MWKQCRNIRGMIVVYTNNKTAYVHITKTN